MSSDVIKEDEPTPPIVLDVNQRAQLEEDSRSSRLAALGSKVDQYFSADPELKEDITTRSFNVPQFGKYHNEGFLMDTHLALIFQNIQNIASGSFLPEVPSDVRQLMQQVVNSNMESLEMYALLHDVSKADCLTLKYDKGEDKEISWEQWTSMIPEGALTSPLAIKAFCEAQGIKSISYTQEGKTHGKTGADRLAAVKEKLNIPDILLKAISRHEVAFQFPAVDVSIYKRNFGDLSEEEIAWVITASYIDTASSLREDMRPDLKNFMNMIDSRHNYLVLQAVEQALRPGGKVVDGIDVGKLKTKVDRELYQAKERIKGTPEEVVERVRRECKINVYNKEKFGENLRALVTTNQITQTDMDELMSGLNEQTGELNWKIIGRIKGRLGEKWALVQEALSVSEVK